jgi:hypothetical protein
MDVITNTEITKVYEGPSGEGQYGPWQIFNFYVKDHKEKFSVFGKDEFVPMPGIKLKLLKYEIKHSEKDGKKYTNYDVKEVILEDEQSEPTSQPAQTQPQAQKSPQKQEVDWDAIAFKKCKYGFLQQAFVPWINDGLNKTTAIMLERYAEEFAGMCMRVLPRATKAPEKPKEPEGKTQSPANIEDPYQGDAPPISSYEGEPPF